MNLENNIPVISGISGRYPESDNIGELYDNLKNKSNMITENRKWPNGYLKLPSKLGQLKDLSKFDSEFFRVPKNNAQLMDPQLRIAHEVCYEAILDSGNCPKDLAGKNIGIFMTGQQNDSHMTLSNIPDYRIILGCASYMMANRLSFAFDFKGPSMNIDTACSSSIIALNTAFDALKNGNCEAALVLGSSIILNPIYLTHFRLLSVYSKSGVCRSYDHLADGYVRAETISAVFLQRKIDAKRIYVTVENVMNNMNGYVEGGIMVPSYEMQKELIENCYRKANINPNQTIYYEGHGSGTPVGDKNELNVLTSVILKDHLNVNSPFIVGSVKSNMGHSENASGMASISKLVLMANKNEILPNINFEKGNKSVEALKNGMVKICTDVQPLLMNGNDYGYLGLTNLGIGGSNAAAIFKVENSNEEIKDAYTLNKNSSLAIACGRNEKMVELLLNKINEEVNGYQMQIQYLIEETSGTDSKYMPYRGYCLLNSKQPNNIIKVHQRKKRAICFIYSGMGTQFKGMGRYLMENVLPFRQSMLESNNILKSKFQFDLYNLMMSDENDDDCYKDVVNSTMVILAIQLALTDTLKCIGLNPDFIIGHSLGENSSAYADNCVSKEEILSMNYYRVIETKEANLNNGRMIAVALSIEKAQEYIDKEFQNVTLACYNSDKSLTLSGLKEQIDDIEKRLLADNIIVKPVNSANTAFHSPSMVPIGEKMLPIFQNILTSPKQSSGKWISTCTKNVYTQKMKSNHFACADYFIDNLLNPVYFYQALLEVPDDVIFIEIGPNCLFQSILKKCKPMSSVYGLAKKSDDMLLFKSLGSIYQLGYNMKVSRLNGTIQLPVDRRTPILSDSIRWNHTASWPVPNYLDFDGNMNCSETNHNNNSNNNFIVKKESNYLVNGKASYPIAGYLQMVMKLFASNIEYGGKYYEIPVTFTNVKFLHKISFEKENETIKLKISINNSGFFEIQQENNELLVSGYISKTLENQEDETSQSMITNGNVFNGIDNKLKYLLNNKDIYTLLRLKNYDIRGEFRCLNQFNGNSVNIVFDDILDNNENEDEYSDYFNILIDGFFQFALLKYSDNSFRLIDGFQNLEVNMNEIIGKSTCKNELNIFYSKESSMYKSSGITLLKVETSISETIPSNHGPLIMDEYVWQPYFMENLDDCKSFENCLGIVLENMKPKWSKIKCLELNEDTNKTDCQNYICTYFDRQPSLCYNYTTSNEMEEDENYDLLILLTSTVSNISKSFEFILTVFDIGENYETPMKLVAKYGRLRLYKVVTKVNSILKINIDNDNFEWLDIIRKRINDFEKIVLISKQSNLTGLVGFVKTLRTEDSYGRKIHGVLYFDDYSNDFDEDEQLNFDLALNIKQNNIWGGYKFRECSQELKKNLCDNSLFEADKAYLVVGGFGAVGLQLIDFLIEHGARSVYVNSRSASLTNCSSLQSYYLKKWQNENGAKLYVSQLDISILSNAIQLIDEILKTSGKLGGIFNVAMLLKDAMFYKQTAENFKLSKKSKVDIANNLDYISKSFPEISKNLKHFVMFSSQTSCRGNCGQTNYAFSNSTLDNICEKRTMEKLPALAMQYGLIGDVGVAMDKFGGNDAIVNGSLAQPIGSIMNTLKYFILNPPSNGIASVFIMGEKRDKTICAIKKNGVSSLIKDILGIDSVNDNELDKDRSLVDFGMDSLTISELRELLRENYNINLDGDKLMNMTINGIDKEIL